MGSELYFTGPPNLGTYMLQAIERIQERDPDLTEAGIRTYPELKPALRFPRRVERFGVSLETLKHLINQASGLTGSNLESFSERCVLVDLLGQHIAQAKGADRWGMKIMRSMKNLPMYSNIWPDAQFIHVVRDGRDVAASQIHDHSSWGYQSISEAARKWASLVIKIHNLVDASLHELRYEDLVMRPEATLRNLTSFLDIPWDPSLLQHHEHRHELARSSVSHPSKAAVGQPINDQAVGRHVDQLTLPDIQRFNQLAEEALICFGYLSQQAPS